jgi:hypothetical protein
VQVATRDLRSRGFTVTLYNLGFPAMVLSRRIEDLGKQYGRDFIPGNIIERQAPVVFTTTTLVTIFTGPNDVDSIVAALGGGAGGADQVSYINTQLQLFAQEFESLIASSTCRTWPACRGARAHRCSSGVRSSCSRSV